MEPNHLDRAFERVVNALLYLGIEVIALMEDKEKPDDQG